MKDKLLLILAAALLTGSMTANAVLISSNGPSTGSNFSFPGVSLNTPSGGSWNNIAFNFFDTNGNAEASGDLFLLASEYLGTPTALSSSTSGFLAMSSGITSNQWIFDSTVTLLQNTTYWLYVDEQFSHTTASGQGGNTAPGVSSYFANSAASNYVQIGGTDWDYTLEGTVCGVPGTPLCNGQIPEPGTLALFSLGLAGLGFARRKKA